MRTKPAPTATTGATLGRVLFSGPYGVPTLTYTGGTATISRDVVLATGTGTINVSTAGTTLTLKCGPSQIELSSSGVTVSGPMINLG